MSSHVVGTVYCPRCGDHVETKHLVEKVAYQPGYLTVWVDSNVSVKHDCKAT